MGTAAAPLVVALIAVIGGVLGGDGHGWGYDDHNGPENWDGLCSSGLFQSPIDLKHSVSHPRTFEPLVFFLYDKQANITLNNNGHTLKLSLEQPCVAQMAGGGLPDAFSLAQIHFHWGSEHTMDGKRYPLEAHFVHYNHKKYDNLGSAVGKENGLAVLGVFYEETEDDAENGALEMLLQHLDEVKGQGSDFRLKAPLRAEQLFPEKTDTFFRYLGSLTTPACNEGVIWTVLEKPAPISLEQVARFKSLSSGSGQIEVNYRPVEPLNGRNLYLRAQSGSPALSAAWPLVAATWPLLRLLTA